MSRARSASQKDHGVKNFTFKSLALGLQKLDELGGQQFMNIINQVNALLTTPAIIAMNKAVAIDKQQPGDVAKTFLQANHITS